MNGNYSSILSLARAGATSRAWDGFFASGLHNLTDNPAAQTLKGRLLKDQARKAQGEAAARLYLQSAKAYADAAALKPDSYPLINAASMSLFAGQTDHMELLAHQVLTLLQTGDGGGETAYWHEATKAEAHLLLGHKDAAQAALSDAIVHAPDAWEDHATTLRQFRQILRFRGETDAWLAQYSPPKSLYFSGLIGISPGDMAAAKAIAEMVDRCGVAFGYGALAAGADILVAEALVHSGGELHVVLPIIPSAFRAQSVEPYGAEWVARFDLLFENAASVEVVGGNDILSEAAIQIAAQVAKGRAIDRASRLESDAIGIEVTDTEPSTPRTEHENTLILPRTGGGSGESTLPGHEAVTLVATDCDTVTWGMADGLHLARFGDLVEAYKASSVIRRDNPDARIAISLTVGNADITSQQRHEPRVTRMVQAAAQGTTIASAEAAMALKSEYPGLWIEPLGELPEASGAVELYAIEATI